MISIPSPGLRFVQERWMQPANQWRKTEMPNGSGGTIVDWIQVGTVPVTFAIPSASERLTAGQEGVNLTHIIKAPLGSDLERGDRLVQNGTTVEVISVLDDATLESVLHARGREEPWDEPTT